MSLFAELRRRRVFRTLALYIVGAWGLMQVADVLLPALGLPEESIRYLLFATIAGFPVALVFGWFFDITANGIHRTRPLSDGEAAVPEPLRAADYGLLAALLLVLGLVLYGVVGGVVEIPLPTASSEQPERAEGPPMVGVLPFEHMGTGEDGEFFASGIHDDLLTRLAKIESLRVISRTSVLQYAGTIKSIPQIGRELRADAVLEGGVRIAGNQIRINAQLIDARSDEHLWAETFDRELTASNIFEVQAEIARAISRALQATLSESDTAELALIPTSNMAAYRAFHETMQWRDKVHLDSSNWEAFINGLEKAYELDPDFTRPMVEAVGAMALRVYGGASSDLLPRIEGLIERIGNIAPNSADFYTAESFYFYYVLRDFERADALIAEAQKKAPSDPRLLEIQAYIKRRKGDWEGYLDTAYRARALEPQNPKHQYMVLTRLMTLHRYADALEELQAANVDAAELNLLRAQVELWQHQSLARYEQDLQTLVGNARGGTRDFYLFSLWEAQLAQRHFAEAALLLEQMRSVPPDAALPLDSVPGDLLGKLMHSLITGDEEALEQHLARTLHLLGAPDSNPANYPSINLSELGLIALASGNRQYVIDRLGKAWNDPAMDRAEWMLERVYYCRFLSMAEALDQANACLRNVLEEPSRALAYLEPYSPAYDAIRNTPEFKQLLSDLSEAGKIRSPN